MEGTIADLKEQLENYSDVHMTARMNQVREQMENKNKSDSRALMEARIRIKELEDYIQSLKVELRQQKQSRVASETEMKALREKLKSSDSQIKTLKQEGVQMLKNTNIRLQQQLNDIQTQSQLNSSERQTRTPIRPKTQSR